ncbi:ABC transporter A family member 1 isoform X1 [Arachis stenosperma]|uniref:ABC transporter A family member 1 isoform X1 n=1 Tax=Arachis stenosperma TaxID=217475 RepID=UPI0025ABAC70|nr:ABC transporter A family member 1 isoform X1 [Arachis stenosperma]XP_057718265.1 ABC transporter A family member 1 isoform X1 [Arachis stenosperma]
MGTASRQLKVMLRKNWLLKIRHPFVTAAEILLPTVVLLLLVAVRTQVDTQIHPAEPHIQKEMFVEVGKGISPNFQQVLASLLEEGEYLAFAPDTDETKLMIDVVSIKFPLLKLVSRVYKDEVELESYIRSDAYGTCSQARNCSNPKIKGAVVFYEQGPQSFDYSIRLNHTWAFSGFPDVKTIMDTNGPFLNDLELGVSAVPTMQYSFSGFFTLQQMVDSFIIFIAQQSGINSSTERITLPLSGFYDTDFSLNATWNQFNPSHIRVSPFPTREYTDDQFQSIIKKVMGILYLLGFLYPVSRLISYSVFEKEQKIKEGLYMMGLKDGIFHLSWFITYALQFAVSSGIITACTMDNLFKYSDKTLVFAYFFIFGLSAIMLSFFISTFFKRAKTAVAVGTLSFLGTFFPYYTVNDEGVSMVLKVLASILSPTAFALGSVNFADYERAHVGLRWTNIWRESSGVNFSLCLLMMILDTLLYCAMGLYFDKVLPREYGRRYPWSFVFRRDFWRKNKTGKHRPSNFEVKIDGRNSESRPSIEAISLDMKQQELDGRCIQIRNLHKVYATRKGDCCAVNSLQLTLYEHQILALLGHNGAGKSTTISMLVGLLPPTSGDALVFGKNIVSDIDEIRKVLGVCPQHDILFPELTVREHLEIFAILKGVDEDSLEAVVTNMADEVGLADKINSVVRALSGGMKRKLSLGIALIGNSKVIILDEPTSGMDPYSMRLTWQLIKKFKKGRIILLTTHSMDEADELGDRIAIMANGSLKCCGSSLFLKHHYGVGYTLTLVKSAPTASIASDIVYRHVPSATCVSEVGTEISFRLPLASSSAFEGMFREIEGCMKKPLLNMEISGSGNEDSLGIESYGISVTTLEEVFLRVAGCDYDGVECFEGNDHSLVSDSVALLGSYDHPSTKKCFLGNYKKFLGLISSIVAGACGLIFAMVISFINFVGMLCCSCCLISRSTFWQHSRALFIKRAISARRDHKTIIFQLIIPAVFLFIGLLFLKLKPHPDQQGLILSTSYFNPLLTGGGGGGPIPFNLSLPIAEKVAQNVKGGWIQRYKPSSYKFPNSGKALADAVEAAGPTLGPALLSMSEYLMSSFNESYQSRYGAIVMDDQNSDGSLGYTVLHNCSCQHAAPTFINVMNSAILRLATGDTNMTIQTRNHPLPMTQSQLVQRHDLDAFSAAIIVNIAFSFIPASFAVPIVKEREVKAKHQQLISGVSVLSYWASTYIWDFVSFLFPASFAIILFYIFGLDQFVGGVSLLPTTLMLLEYGLAVASSTYCLTFFFFDHTMAQNVVLLIHFFTGLILMVISFIMGLIPNTTTANTFLKNFFRISPGFCFADGLASLALLRQGMKDKTSDGIFDWNVSGASICYLAVESIGYFCLTLALEVCPSLKLTPFMIKKWWQSLNIFQRNTTYLEPLLEPSMETVSMDFDEDVDVKTERNRVLSGSLDNSIIYLRNLRKVYSEGKYLGEKVAVDSLTFSVQEGECFGFLGTNGAGKTTTLSMLCGEESPSDGTAFIFGKDICSHPKAARQYIGYCPQFDALLEFLTVQEHLELYARIKGVPEYTIDNVVKEKMVEFGLLKHANKPSFTLSGGNKRKLSVAIAMIGDPPIVILDEPSTGMDPIAKRFMWDVISRISTRRGKTAVILTTHSMNEAQALCTRMGIMVGGRLRCIGSPQHLKTRFGNHLELEVKPTEVSSADLQTLCQAIQERVLYVPSHPRSLLGDLEVCIGATDSITAENSSIAEISLTREMISLIGRWLGNEERVKTLISCTPVSDGASREQLSEQLFRDGGIPLPVFSEWWLSKQKFSEIDSFILSSFRGARWQGCNGLNIRYQIPYEEGLSLADVFGHLEGNRGRLGIAEYSISQSTLETIFNHFAATS